MTESEAIAKFKRTSVLWESATNKEIVEAVKVAIQALEEVQEYRALESKLNGISVEQVVNGFINQVEKETHEGYEKGRILTNAEADDWNAYRAIGTVEEFKAIKQWKADIIESFCKYDVNSVEELMQEFKALKEKAEPKKPKIERVNFSHNQYANNYKCPTCGARMISKDETGWYSGRRSKYCEECGTAIDWE